MTTTLSPDRTAWREAVADIAEKAKATLPECNGRVEKAVVLVLAGDVELLPDGHAKVASQSNGTTNYRIVNGTCDCKDFAQAPSGWCTHRVAAGIHKRAEARFQTPLARVSDDPAETLADAPDEPPHGIDPRFITSLHGKPFIRDAGLLAMAHARGLVSLKARFLSVTADLALAEAEAVLADGKTCSACADSTPGNVPSHMKPHFPRMALTRCNARCLRDVAPYWHHSPRRTGGRIMATYSKTFAHIRRRKAAAYRARKKAAKQAAAQQGPRGA